MPTSPDDLEERVRQLEIRVAALEDPHRCPMCSGPARHTDYADCSYYGRPYRGQEEFV